MKTIKEPSHSKSNGVRGTKRIKGMSGDTSTIQSFFSKTKKTNVPLSVDEAMLLDDDEPIEEAVEKRPLFTSWGILSRGGCF